MADFSPMTDEQRQRWKDTGLFPVERWDTGPGSTPLVCPLPDRALLRALAEAIPAHVQSSGWYATGQRYEARTVHSVYGDDFRGMGRQAIASVISFGSYSGPLADYIAAACPRTVLRLLDRIEELERATDGVPVAHPTDGERDLAALCVRLVRRLREVSPDDKLGATATDYLNQRRYLNPLRIKAMGPAPADGVPVAPKTPDGEPT